MRTSKRALVVAGATMAMAFTSTAAYAHECVNASRNGTAGAQLVLDMNDEPIWVSKGLQQRIEQGIVDFETGEGFSGIIGFDIDGDGVGDLATWIVGPNGEIPLKAQWNGPVCKGVTNIGLYFEECFGG
jgi:hypothetical protein